MAKKIFLSLFLILILFLTINISISNSEESEKFKNFKIYLTALRMDKAIIREDINFTIQNYSLKYIVENDPVARIYLKSKIVRVSAYNNTTDQTDDTPDICAWNDRIRPGIVAVSRNLIGEGLGRNAEVYVNGEVYTVLDKMNKRWKDSVDIYFGGEDKRKEARKFGVKKIRIFWKGELGEG